RSGYARLVRRVFLAAPGGPHRGPVRSARRAAAMTTTTRLEIGPLEPFHAAGVLGIPDVQVATALMRIDGHSLDEPHSAGVALAAALCVRALRAGSVCVDLTADPSMWIPEDGDAPPEALPWL